MNVLVLNGSPKGESGNTARLSRAFLEGAGWSGAETVNVADLEIRPCAGCFACWNKTPGTCAIADDMDDILPKLISADVVVWSFPLYYFSVPGGLKNLIDRQLPLNLPFMATGNDSGGHPARYDLSRQRTVVISTCGFWTAEGNYDGVVALFDHLLGAGTYARIFCAQGELFRVPELRSRTNEYLEIVRQAGAEYSANGTISLKTETALLEPLYPRDVFERMADASWGLAASEAHPTDDSDDSLQFTTQMTALYNPDGKERVVEFYYTDIDKTYQIVLTGQGASVRADDFKPYSTRIETPYTVWRAIARDEISGTDALFQKLYRVLGDFDLMLHWDELFGGAAKPDKTAKSERKTNMSVLLVPWIVLWVALAIDPIVGGTVGIIAAALMPVAWLLVKPTPYEQLSVPILAGLSLAAMLGADMRLVLPLSYGIFGAMWLATAFKKTPLTAYYSAKRYGADRAFQNRLFMRTNRILTVTWGALYLVMPVWTYFLMRTDISAYTALINSTMPALMGIFTAWFQKWHPARQARG
jgi:multimeric flavodoxin WrbA